MKINVRIFLITILLFMSFPNFAQRAEWAGIWGIWGGQAYSNYVYPWYKGTLVTTNWKTIQPQKDVFNFSNLDRDINRAVNNGLFVLFKVYIAPDPPQWLNTELGVPFFKTDEGLDWNSDPVYPYYLDPVFEQEFKKMITAVAAHIETYPENVRKKIIAVQAPMGKSGDQQPYDGKPLDPQYIIDVNGTEWRDYNRRMLIHFRDTYKNKDPKIELFFKTVSNNWSWALTNLPNSSRKAQYVAQGYHLSTEGNALLGMKEFVNVEVDGYMRGEFDAAVKTNSEWFNAAPIWNVYWAGLWCLTYNLDMWNMRTQIMNNPHPYVTAMEFFSKWAGYKKPEYSIGAWAAFRDDIDYDDIQRFSESVYGEYRVPSINNPNLTRYNAILNDFTPYGAKQDDPGSVTLRHLNVLKNQKGFNDVQRDVWRGNYRMHMFQIDANETSQGYWRVGPKDQPYGRFARGFNPSAGKNAIYLDIANDLFKNERSGDSIVSAEVEIIYFDSGTGSWEVRYDARDNPDKKALSVTNTNTGVWKTISITLNDARFSNQGPRGSDISIVNADEQVNIFHMLKIEKKDTAANTDPIDLDPGQSNAYCYPNPFNPGKGELTIAWPASGDFRNHINIYNLQGKLVRQLTVTKQDFNDTTQYTWDGRDEGGNSVNNGFYLGEIIGKKNSRRFKFLVVS